MFRRLDHQSMVFAIDLWDYSSVKDHGSAIVARLRAGSMPCDGPWPQEKVEVFQRWLDEGTPN
jgi:hypothetical protein